MVYVTAVIDCMNSKMKIFDPDENFYHNFCSIKSCINLSTKL